MKLPDERLSNINDIRLLLCYVICNSPGSVSREVLLEALQSYGYVNYFDAAAAFSELLRDESICEDGKNKGHYLVTDKGRLIAQELKRDLPSLIREKALAATVNLLSKVKNAQENRINVSEEENGFCVKASISGGEGLTLMSFSLYVPDEDQAKLIKRNFLDSPQTVYECMLAALTKNPSIVKNLLEKDVEGM